jgi:hypothetical protein
MGYAVKLQPQVAQIYNGDKVNVALTGSNTGTYVFSVCYVAKDEVCLLSDTSMGTANWSTACAKSWGWSCKIRGKQYSSSDAGQSVAKIPTLEEIKNNCGGYDNGSNYWSSTIYNTSGSTIWAWIINAMANSYYAGRITNEYTNGQYARTSGIVPYIHVIL